MISLFNYSLLSYPISLETPLYGSTPPIEQKTFSSIEGGQSANSTLLTFHNHYGTHMDCPRHFIQDGKCLTDYSPADFNFFSPSVLDVSLREGEMILLEHLKEFEIKIANADILFIRTGFWKRRNEQKYKTHNPGVSVEAFQYLRANFHNVKAVGIDAISVSSFQHREVGRKAHREAFRRDPSYGEPLLLIEDVNLMDAGPFEAVMVSPIFSLPIDASPVIITALKAK